MTVVVGYIPTAEGRTAMAAAMEEVHERGDKLIIVNSATGSAYMDSSMATTEDLEELVKASKSRGIDVEVRQLPRGQAATEEILQVVEDTNARLLVIGLRRRSPVGKLFLGSTAQELLLKSTCPVLAVKPGT
ncbi:nucleotide-binding universal stress UspA family protein [Arthrobacter sp. CAN_A214]|uniref:universal stress protein n=1 Tax=Arthrobacter sp. CAN_A214 TaxID=2787720 RepID=UPI0018C9268E